MSEPTRKEWQDWAGVFVDAEEKQAAAELVTRYQVEFERMVQGQANQQYANLFGPGIGASSLMQNLFGIGSCPYCGK